jgi:hypothetical protein
MASTHTTDVAFAVPEMVTLAGGKALCNKYLFESVAGMMLPDGNGLAASRVTMEVVAAVGITVYGAKFVQSPNSS